MTSTKRGCLSTILGLFGGQPQTARPRGTVQYIPADEEEDGNLPYRVRDDFLSNSELSFYHVLRSVVNDRAVICPAMNLSSIFYVTRPNENQSFRARISQKSIDFLLCEPKTMKPLVGIELDDTSHTRADRQNRDEFVNKAFEAAQLPLLRIPAKRAYTTSELAAQLEPFIGSSPSASVSTTHQSTPASVQPEASSEPQLPLCPKCGIPMVVRTVAQGEYKDRKFYGCANYPRCRQMLPYQESKLS